MIQQPLVLRLSKHVRVAVDGHTSLSLKTA
jgi:hypothetical protein